MDNEKQCCNITYEKISFYYMANPVLGKSMCSDWFLLGQDFAVWTVSMETVQSVYFCFIFFTLNLPAEAKKIDIFPKFQRSMKKSYIFVVQATGSTFYYQEQSAI